MSNDGPEVSVVTPTYNRRKFIPTLIEIYRAQTFPKHRMEWIIIDDGPESVADLFEEAAKTLPNVRYLRMEDKLRIGAKRNLLNDAACAPIIVAMDDDDYYPPDRVETVVRAFKKYPRVDLAGSSEMNLYYVDTRVIYTVGPYSPNHATNGTMAWRKTYADRHRYNEYVTQAEEVSFLQDYRHPMIQLDPKKTILVLCHSDNTVDKQDLRQEHLSAVHDHPSKMRRSPLQLADVVREPERRAFYESLA